MQRADDGRFDLLIRNATIVDGSGSPGYLGDLAVRGDRIAALAPARLDGSAARTLDAKRLVLSPGFIDVHSHDDFAVLLDPEMSCKVMQGVTTDVVGNCGFGPAPRIASASLAATFPDRTLPDWQGHRGYLARLGTEPASLNVAMLVGHGSIRVAAMEHPRQQPSARELDRMRAELREGLDAGAVGFSSGLIYEPGMHAQTEELIALAREMSSCGGLYATHMRNEASGLLDSVRETLRIGEEGSVPVQISHHKAAGKPAWGLVRESLRLIEEARARGLDVHADQYPYTAGSTLLRAVLGSVTGEIDPARRMDMDPENVVIAASPHDTSLEGKSIAAIARERGEPAADVARRIVASDGDKAWVVMHIMCEEDVQSVLRHPSTMIGSDGLPGSAGKPHPRLYGTFARILGHYVREAQLLGLEEAVHRMTGLPARKFRLGDRGILREGLAADLVLFDPETIDDVATYADPRRHPSGIHHVFVNGSAVVTDGAHTGARPGKPLRRAS